MSTGKITIEFETEEVKSFHPCQIIVESEIEDVKIILFRKHDGYPHGEHGVLATLVPLVARYKQYEGWRAGRLAAHILAGQIQAVRGKLRKFHTEMAQDKNRSNDKEFHERRAAEVEGEFTDFEICTEERGWVDYTYRVRCNGIHVYDNRGREMTTPEEAKAMVKGEIPGWF